MFEKPGDTASFSESRAKSLLAPHRIALIFLWSLTIVAVFIMLLNEVRATGQYETGRYVLQTFYVAALLWYLSRTGRALPMSPETVPQVSPIEKYITYVPPLVITLMFVLMAVSDEGLGILLLLLVIAILWILIAWRREIRLHSVVQGGIIALIAYTAGRLIADNEFIGEKVLNLFSILTAPMYVAGALLFERSRLGGIQLHARQYGEALKSFLWGAGLFIPLGLINAADGSPGTGITWVNEWWMPVSLPFFSGIAEETFFRLFLVGLCFYLLYPVFRRRPGLAVMASVLFSGITFGLAHGRTVERFLTTGLLYGVPMAAVFARRDWEYAVGAHYMINFVPWLLVFLES